MIELATGNLLEAPAEALVNTVNTKGIMGKGIALQFSQAFPQMFQAYEKACKAGDVALGKMDVHDLGGLVGGPRWIINFPTKDHWKSKSRIADIEAGLADLVATVRRLQIHSIAVPPLGCGYGGLQWCDVRPLIEAAFAAVPEVKVLLYAPAGAPKAAEMPNKTTRPAMTIGQAALLVLMDRYLKALLDPFVSLLEIHKLMYFLQEAGQPLKLNYEAHSYGPFATNLRHVLIRLEKHYTLGYGEGNDNPTKPIELLPGAVETAQTFLEQAAEMRRRMDKVLALIDGFEDPYGLELLSSLHWVSRTNPAVAHNPEAAITAVHQWNSRKQRELKKEHLHKAWLRLQDQDWLPA